MALPLKTTADDVRDIVKYLKTKPTGATTAEAKAINSRMTDGRKLAAYVSWGFVVREDGKLKLSNRGTTLARHPDREAELFRSVVDANRAYRSVIEWAHHQGMDAIDTNDAAQHWHEHHADLVGQDATDETLRQNAVCFFNIAEAAGLGRTIAGRGGKLTRLEIDRSAVAAMIEAGPSTPPWEEPSEDGTGVELEDAETPPADEHDEESPAPFAEHCGSNRRPRQRRTGCPRRTWDQG